MTRPDPKAQHLIRVQAQLGYRFRNPALLRQALTHRSHSARNNERFEFVGDSILDYVVAKMLFDAFPNLPEGRLSPMRAQLVKEATLAETARSIGIGRALNLGVGELKSGGSDRDSILADAMEALFAAISFDSDFAAAEETVRRLFAPRIRTLDMTTQAKDAKTRLQEALQAQHLPLPKYRIEKQTGEGNEALFDVSCDLGELGKITYAQGRSRRAAEQECAAEALAWFEQHHAKGKKK